MQTAIKKRRGPPSTPPKPKIVGGLVKFLPPSYTDRVSSTRHIHRGIIGHIVDQPVVVISDKVGDDGCVRVLQIASISKNKLKRVYETDYPLMARFVPIEPSEPHPDTGGVLLSAGPGTRKRLPPDPYVDIGESTLVPFVTLRDYNGARNGREKLSLVPESYVQLAEKWASWKAAESSPGLDGVGLVALLVTVLLGCLALFGRSYLGIEK